MLEISRLIKKWFSKSIKIQIKKDGVIRNEKTLSQIKIRHSSNFKGDDEFGYYNNWVL